jgi:hypothetical protein
MNQSTLIWEDELLREYRSNRFEFLKKTKKLFFEFDEDLTLSQYLSRKINLLHDAEIHDEEIMISRLWEELDVNLTLATSVRDDEDTLESFERRVRENEATVRRIHEREKERFKYEKKDRSEKKFYFRYSEQIKKSYKKENNISTERVQRLLNKLIIKESFDQNKDRTRKSLISANENVVSRKSLRSCRHCDENHWDNECENKKFVRKIMMIDDKLVIDFFDKDLEIYRNLKRVVAVIDSSDSKKE